MFQLEGCLQYKRMLRLNAHALHYIFMYNNVLVLVGLLFLIAYSEPSN